MAKSKFLYPLFLVTVSFWLMGTILIDFFIVPSVFQIVQDFFNAGELGIKVFSTFNKVELILASALVVESLKTKKIPLISIVLILFTLIIFYFSFLTPKITELTNLWRASGDVISQGKDYQQEHQYFHKMYVGLDSIKLLLLLTLCGLGVWKQEWFR